MKHYKLLPVLLLASLLASCGTVNEEAAPTVNASSVIRIADRAREGGDVTMAANMYKRAVTMEPDNIVAHQRLGQALLELGDANGATEELKWVVEKDKKNPEARRLYANALAAAEKYADAEKQLTEAIALKPDAKLYNSLGIVKDLQGEGEAARKAYNAGLELEPDDLTIRNNLGLSLALNNKAADAIKILQEAVKQRLATDKHRQNLALAYVMAGQSDTADRLLRLDMNEEEADRKMDFFERIAKLPTPQARMQRLMRGMGGGAGT